MGGFFMRRETRFNFDPTSNMALAHVAAQARRDAESPMLTADPYQASPEDLARFAGHTFEPDKLVTRKQLRAMRYRREFLARVQ